MKLFKNFTGHKFGLIEVLHKVQEGNAAETTWMAICACGVTFEVGHKLLTSNKKKTCGCGLKTTKFLPGNRYGRLTITSRGSLVKTPTRNYRMINCTCDCGNTIEVRDYNLSSGNSESCGVCTKGTHRMSNTRTYRIWEGMKRRCNPDLADQFPYHAGKGISYDLSWSSFENFYNDMGFAPEGLSLDRIDGNSHYCKENCRWETESVQGYNKGLDPNNTSGKSGVSFYTQQGKWSAEIHVEGEHIHLGMFEKFEDAVSARKVAELKYYGWNKQ